MAEKSDRQQCSDDWKDLTCKIEETNRLTFQNTVVIFNKKYVGFESLYDMDRDVCEAVSTDYNPLAAALEGEYEGTVQVIITYTPKGKTK